MPTLLVVDDEQSILLAFQRAFHSEEMTVLTAKNAGDGLCCIAEHRPDVVVLDVQLPDQSGLEMLRSLRAINTRCPVIFITGKSTTDTAIEAMKLGAYEYLLKPLELAQIRRVIDRAMTISRMMSVPAVVASETYVDDRADAIVGQCGAMQEVYKAIGRVAGQDVTVFITGESGTGKELVARALYQHSRRASGPFLAINCAAIPEQLLESELFGHEKGAFTGADRQRIGKFEQCAGGTVFLDEVADLSQLAQGKVLRLLQEQSFERLGSNEVIRANVRLLAATNQDLEQMVEKGAFRQDLYYRLSVFSIHLPPLRERGDDLPLLVQHYVHRFSREFNKDVQTIPRDTMDLLTRNSWPGNVRELQSVLKQALLQAMGNALAPDFLPAYLRGESGPGKRSGWVKADGIQDESDWQFAPFIEQRLRNGATDLYEEVLHEMEKRLVTRVLQHTSGNQLQAARILGITRGSLRNKVRDLGITIARKVSHDSDED